MTEDMEQEQSSTTKAGPAEGRDDVTVTRPHFHPKPKGAVSPDPKRRPVWCTWFGGWCGGHNCFCELELGA